ncbi:cobalamin biosynthesis protein [Propioniciclava sp.]|uniref:cobalamin biosynthesis protein n=1 Tax=Propioniciclava sp. TaxID=2038686 RepID=UPI00261413EA|nr:cobalamin biosynthesis protein [Propioniciclava sp.]
MRGPGTATALGLALGWTADQLLGDPRRWHPVAGFGRLATAVEQRTYADDRLRGAVHVAVLVGGTAALGSLVSRSARHPVLATLATAAATWTVLGGRSLARESEAVAAHLAADDLAAARLQVSHLVSRDPQTLDADGVARAALESVAENTSDAVVAPLFWGAIAGIPGLLAYRAVNTLDAMVGYRNDRYRNFGWAAAKLDDLANLLPARISGGLAVLTAPLVGGRPTDALRAVRDQSGGHPSPNGGVVEAAFAGALRVTLGGRNTYGGVEEDRGELGHGPAPSAADLARANRLALAVSAGAAGLSVLAALARRR